MNGPPGQQRVLRIALGLPVAFAVGFLAAFSGVTVPAPPSLLGALIVASMTLGYVVADRFLAARAARCGDLCAGPSGDIKPTQARRS